MSAELSRAPVGDMIAHSRLLEAVTDAESP